MKKKILLTLGSVAAIAAPIAAVISCSAKFISPSDLHKVRVELTTSNTKAQNSAIVRRAREQYIASHGSTDNLLFEMNFTFKDGSHTLINSMQLSSIIEVDSDLGDDIAQGIVGSIVGDKSVHLSHAHKLEVRASAPDVSLMDNL